MNIFLNAPADLDALWKALARPDFVILRGDEYARLRSALQGVSARPSPWSSVVDLVTVEGVVRDDQASLTIGLGITLAGDGSVWVPIRLDGLTLAGAREGDRDLAVRSAEGGGRQVELSGRGKHTIQVKAVLLVLSTPEGKRLELAIPEAATTRLAIDVPRRVSSAHAGTADPVMLTPLRDRGMTRLVADLPPRPRLSLVWRAEEEAGTPLPPLLVAQGEIAIDVEPGSFRTQSSWVVRSVRGTARSLQFRLDPAEEVLDLELDGQPPPAGLDKVDGLPRLTIPLTDPLEPGEERKLVMSTLRPIAVGDTTRISFSGFALTNTREQAGAIGVTQGGGLWISGTAARGVRQIDPRTELPTELRARPGIVLAYQFSVQPFEINLRIEPSPPQVRSEARTTVLVEPGSSRIDTWLDYQTARGRLYELTIGVPPGLEIESVGPDEVVSAWQIGAPSAGPPPGNEAAGLRLLTVRLLPRVQDAGRFGLHIVGRQPLVPAREARIGLLRPLGVVPGGGQIAVLTDPSLTVDLSGPGDSPAGGDGIFHPAAQAPPADWLWPAGRTPTSAPMLWLRYLQTPGELPLRVSTHPRTVTHATSLQVRVGRQEVDVQQETECSIRFGSLDHLDVDVPVALEGRWELEGAGVATRSDLGRSERGNRTFRLTFTGEVSHTTRLRFHYHLPVGPSLEPGRPLDMQVPWIRPVGSVPAPGPLRATVTAEPGLGLAIVSPSWQPAADPSAPVPPGGEFEGSAERLVRASSEAEAGTLDLRVSVRPLAALPGLVVPRLGLRTVQTPEGDLRTSAWFGVETRQGSLSFSLPPGAELQRVRVGGEVIAQIEQLGPGGGYRVVLPSRPQDGTPLPVELDYVVPAARARGAWVPASLLEGGIIQQTYWEVRLPWSRALVGVPSGWSDENEWYWDVYVWKRRPWGRMNDAASWVAGGPARSTGVARSDADDPRGDYHAYMFGRPSRPVDLPITVVSRAWLVALGSGSVLAVGGLLILVWRPSLRLVWVAALVLGLSVAALLHPSVTFLVVQSSVIGLLLTALLAVMQRVVDHRRRAAAVFGEPGGSSPAPAPGSSFNRGVGVPGSDDSTAIRVRPVQVSTMDFASPPPSAVDGSESARAADGVVGRSSWSERVGPGGASP